MICPRCQYDNRPTAKFCEQCATSLGRACRECGAPLSPTARFCQECAHPTSAPSVEAGRFASPHAYTPGHLAERILASKSALEGERKQMDMRFWLENAEPEIKGDRVEA